MAQNTLTASEAHTMVLLSRSHSWSRGYRNTDGLQFVLFSGSAGQTYLSSESGCTCRSWKFRLACAHQAAVKAEAEKARAAAVRRPKATYEDLDFGLEDAF